jgi:predicted LPLAT superfamily acyltransferase
MRLADEISLLGDRAKQVGNDSLFRACSIAQHFELAEGPKGRTIAPEDLGVTIQQYAEAVSGFVSSTPYTQAWFNFYEHVVYLRIAT